MDIPDLKAFVSVAQEASFSKAAIQLSMSQPAISRRIQSLESNIGQKLFQRIGQTIELTEAGAQLLPRAQEILELIEKTKHEIDGLGDSVQGQLRMAISHHFAEHYLAKILETFTTLYPQVQLAFQFLESEQACALVGQGKADLALGTLPLDLAQANGRELLSEKLVIAVSRQHRLANSACDAALLNTYQAVLPPMSGFTGQSIQQAFDGLGLHPSQAIECNAFTSLKSLLKARLGWGILPARLLDSSLCEIELPPHHYLTRILGVLTSPLKQPSTATRAFLGLKLDQLLSSDYLPE